MLFQDAFRAMTPVRLCRAASTTTARLCHGPERKHPAEELRRARKPSSEDSSSSTGRGDKRQLLDQLGTWDLRMNFPLLEESSIRRGIPIPMVSVDQVGVCCNQGRRPYQEDRFNVAQLSAELLLMAVWDGHGGDEAADFCHLHVQRFLERRLESQDTAKVDLGKVITDVLLELDAAFERQWKAKVGVEVPISRTPGTTATVVLIREGYELVVGHLGDSRALLCREGQARCLTTEHSPSLPQEKARIESAGGFVSTDASGRSRVNHRLAMSRSIGDLDLKPMGVIALAEVVRHRIKHGKDRFLALVTDGICDVMSNEEIVRFVAHCDTPAESAERLVDQALLFSCEDNATALVLPLGSWGKSEDAKTSVLFSLGRNMSFTSRYN